MKQTKWATPSPQWDVCNVSDIDECSSDGHEELCTLEGQKCVNTAGSYKCICKSGYMKDGDGCKLRPKGKNRCELARFSSGSERRLAASIFFSLLRQWHLTFVSVWFMDVYWQKWTAITALPSIRFACLWVSLTLHRESVGPCLWVFPNVAQGLTPLCIKMSSS